MNLVGKLSCLNDATHLKHTTTTSEFTHYKKCITYPVNLRQIIYAYACVRTCVSGFLSWSSPEADLSVAVSGSDAVIFGVAGHAGEGVSGSHLTRGAQRKPVGIRTVEGHHENHHVERRECVSLLI